MQRTREKELELLEAFPKERITVLPPHSIYWVRPKQRWSFRNKAVVDNNTNKPVDKEKLT